MIRPAYRIMLRYSVQPDQFETYFRYITREFVPMMQQFGLPMIWAWQVYGEEYPERQLDFVCESRLTLEQALTSDRFLQAEEYLQTFTTSYSRKIVSFENRYQF